MSTKSGPMYWGVIMALDDLIAQLEREAVAPVAPGCKARATAKPLPLLGCTAVAPVAPKIDECEERVPTTPFMENPSRELLFIGATGATPATSQIWQGFEAVAPSKNKVLPGATATADSDWPAIRCQPGRRNADAPLPQDQEGAIVAWLAQIGETDDAMVSDVLVQCRRNGEARAYYLDQAGEEHTDRRRCTECSNLRAGVCIVARPGGVVSAIRGYRPVLVNVPVRCAGYSRIEISGG